MIFLWTVLLIVIWIAIAFWPARVAGRKGHSFIGYFIFSLFFFPAALIVAYLVGAGLCLSSSAEPGQPPRAGSGLIEAESHATRQGFGERDPSGSLKIAAEQIGLPSSSERLLRGGRGSG